MSGSALFDAGYTDLVLIRPNQKAPAMKGWLYNRPSKDEVEQWQGSLGVIAEEYPAVDIDLYDEALANEIQRYVIQIVGAAPLRLSHRPASRLLVYRTDKPYPKKVLTLPDGKGKVEILGTGRQYLVQGVHPEGTPYRWAKSALWEVPAHKLNVMDEAQADTLLRTLQERFGGVLANRSPSERTGEADMAPSPEALLDALARIPNTDEFLMQAFPGHAEPREAWIAFGHAVYGAGGPEFEPHWMDWCATYDGVSNPDHDRHAYRSFGGTTIGWDVIDRVLREHCPPEPEEDFDFDLDEPVEQHQFPDGVRLTDEYVLDRILPGLQQKAVNIAGAWYAWDGSTWRRDETMRFDMAVRTLLRPFALDLASRAGLSPDKNERKNLMEAAKKYQNRSGINAMRELAAAPLAKPMEDFDRDIMALNTPAGIVNLADGSIRPTRPEDHVTRCTTVAPTDEYAVSAAPNWASFLDHLTGGDDDLKAFLQRWCGYCLTGNMGEKKLVFVYGANSNTGKSTFVNAVNHAIGNYGRGTDVGTFMGTKENTDALAQLPGVRLASATEASAGQKWDDKIVKAITGGDLIEARQLFQSYFTFKPQFKMMVAGNHRPALNNVDAAMLKRVLIVPMNIPVKEEDIDRSLGMKLEAEAPSILRWMIDGCLAWQQEGLAPPEAVQAATDEYAHEADSLALWLDENCAVGDPEDWTGSTELYNNWQAWNWARGVKGRQEIGTRTGLVTAIKVAMETDALPVAPARRKTGNGFIGIRLNLGGATAELEDLV